MLREEETNKKKSNEVNYLKKRSIDISDVQSIKIKKNDNNDGDKKIYQIPKVCNFVLKSKIKIDEILNILFFISVNNSK